jgi:N-acetylneuraminic acid mutarotase
MKSYALRAILIGLLLLVSTCEQKQFGSIEISSTPPGAAVFLDGMPTTQQTTCTLDSIDPGTHTIRLVLTGYKDYYDTVEVDGSKTVKIAAIFSRSMGAIHIVTNPTGADVLLDNATTGKKTNCILDSILIGTHDIKLTHAGYADYYDQLIVREDQTTEISVNLNPAFGMLHITSTPTGADVFVDNAATGRKTNCVINNLAAGDHPVKLTLAGYADYTDNVLIIAGQTAELNATLSKSTGFIQVNSTPTGAQVYLDATNTDKITNCLLSGVEVGIRSIRLIKANYKEWQGNVTVAANQTATVNANLASATGSIQVNSTPTGAEIFLDNTATGDSTNFLLTNVTVGNHTIKLIKAGYQDWQTPVTVAEDQTATVDGVLEKLSPWQTKSSMQIPRAGLACGVVAGKLYAIDGTMGITPGASFIEEYDPAVDSWTTKNQPPANRDGLGFATVNDKIYCIGGEDEMMFPVSTVEAYDPANDSWQTKAPMPTPRVGLGCAAVNNKIYAIGGMDTLRTAVGTVEEYDPNSDTWRTKASMPTPRSGVACVAVNGKIYAIGGLDEFYMPVGTVEVYDPAANSWQTKTDMPTARYLAGAEAVNGKIYCIGGNASFTIVATVEEYDPAADQWQLKTSMPTARAGLVCGMINNKIYALGGQDASYQPLATLEEYDPTIE